MPNKKRQQRKRRGNALKDFPVAPSTAAVLYRGVIPNNTAENGITAVLRSVATLATGGGTSFNSILDNNPSSADNWTEYSTSWSEYRMLGIRYEFVPQFAVNTTAVAVAPLVHCILHMKANPAIASYPQALSYGDSRVGHVTKRHTREWRMASTEEAAFVDTGSPAGTAVTYTNYAEGLTTATGYGFIFITWFVQFRNARK